jgi:tetratricopeptide (TPR) repeat protein
MRTQLQNIVLILALLFLSVPSLMAAPPEKDDYRKNIVESISNKIYNAYRFTSSPPIVKIIYDPLTQLSDIFKFDFKHALYVPYGVKNKSERDTIFLDIKAYNSCVEFGEDSLDALAYVIGHELGHYFQKHNEDSELGNHDITTDSWRFNTDQRKEAEADMFAGFFGHLAGYNTLGVSSPLLRKLFKPKELSSSKYPNLKQRIAISDSVNVRLKELLVTFDAGIYFMASQHYQEARACFQYLSSVDAFPSREMYNNLGAALYYEAMSLVDEGTDFYHMPIVVDNESRLHVRKIAPDAISFNFGGNEVRKLLSEAEAAFKYASSMDSLYWISYFNSICISSLLHPGESTFDLLESFKGNKTFVEDASELGRLDHLTALVHIHDKRKAKRSFKKALACNDNATWNHSLFQGDPKNSSTQEDGILENYDCLEQAIHELSIDSIRSLLSECNLIKLDSSQTRLGTYTHSKWTALHYEIGEEVEDDLWGESGGSLKWNNIVMMNENSQNSTSCSIAIGSSEDEVLDAYGIPTIETQMRSTRFMYFKSQQIIFEIRENKVARWALVIE